MSLDIHRRVFEDDGPFFRIIDPLSGVGGIVLVPGAGDGLGEVDDGVCGDIEGTVGAIAGDGKLGGGGEAAAEEGGDGAGGDFHGGVFEVWNDWKGGLRKVRVPRN